MENIKVFSCQIKETFIFIVAEIFPVFKMLNLECWQFQQSGKLKKLLSTHNFGSKPEHSQDFVFVFVYFAASASQSVHNIPE